MDASARFPVEVCFLCNGARPAAFEVGGAGNKSAPNCLKAVVNIQSRDVQGAAALKDGCRGPCPG